jgi:transcription initiation factor TFIIB
MSTLDNSKGIIFTGRIISIKAKPHKYNTSKNIATMEADLYLDAKSTNISGPLRVECIGNSGEQCSEELNQNILKPISSDTYHIQLHSKEKSKTHKKKTTISQAEKARLWDIFDTDKTTQSNLNTLTTEIKCVYEPSEQGLCNLCNSVLVIMEDGFPTCTNSECSVMCTDTLDYSPEWRFYGADDKNAADPTRCGNPINPLLVESSFGCKVMASSNLSYEMKKIRKWTEWQSMPHKEKSLYNEFQFITIMAQNAGIPKILIDDAISIHKDISEQKMFRGLNRDGIKAASIYISCRLNGCPRTAHEIAEIFSLDKTSATNGCSMAVNILHNIERSVDLSQQTELQMTTPSSFIERYCSKLNMNGELTMLCKFIAKKLEQNNIITDNTPHAIAAGIVYFISHYCNMNISKTHIKQISGVSDVTINKCFKKMDVIRDTLLPKCIIDKYL